ncbi:MAG: nucleotidyltransferase domain-containing protein [Anaerolineae bacterium]|nr:nucleotidyltransferase domain-containing protein [Anaerolineae bacterium]
MQDIRAFLEQLDQWLAQESAISAVLLVGSHARGAARADSDIDLVLMADDPTVYLQDPRWLTVFGQVNRAEVEDWGMVQSIRVFYADGLEVEFGLTTSQWAAVDPVDAGTEGVVRDGARILLDRPGQLAALLAAVSGQ